MSDQEKTLQDSLKGIQDTMTAKMGEYHAELEKHGNVSTELTGSIDELSGKFKEMQDELADLAQKQVPGSLEGKSETAGQEFVKSDAFKALAERRVERARFEVKNTVVTGEGMPWEMQRPGVIPGSFEPLTIRQQIPTITVSTNAVNALREDDFTNNAAEVAEGAEKNESDITFSPYNVAIETVAHWIKVSSQLLADAPAITAYIDTRLRDGLAQRIERQLLLGNGVTPNLSGLTNAGNFTAFTPTAGANLAESINKAKYDRWAVGEVVDTAIVNPADWAAMEVLREGAGTGAYLYGTPGTTAGRTVFGIDIVLSPNMPTGSFLVGALRTSAVIYQRQGAVVEMGFVNDDFTRNLVTLRAEERLGLGIDRPMGIVYGDITAVE